MKKSKAIENMCSELGLETQPPCTEEVCAEFNELRSDMVLLYELKVRKNIEPIEKIFKVICLRVR